MTSLAGGCKNTPLLTEAHLTMLLFSVWKRMNVLTLSGIISQNTFLRSCFNNHHCASEYMNVRFLFAEIL